MFVIAIRRTGTEKPATISGLKHERTSLDQQFVCDIHCDGARFQLRKDANEQTLIDTVLSDAEIFRFKPRESEGTLHRPLMLGLPIYSVVRDSEVFFSTHVRLLRQAGIQLKENTRVLPEYFVYRYISPPATLFQDVNCIPVGGTLRFHFTGSQLKCTDPEWTTVFNKSPRPLSFTESVDVIAEDIRKDILALRPFRDQVGCLLSGGIDSSTLYKLAKDHLSLNESHSTGYPFEDQANNGERIYAEAAAEILGSRHHYHTFSTEQYLHALIDAVDHAEIPMVHLQSALLELLFAQALGPHNRIVLNGQGADGIFGSTMMWWYQRYQRLLQFPISLLVGILSRTPANRSFPYRKMYDWSKLDWSLNLAKPNHAIWLMGQFGDKAWVREYFRVDDSEIDRNRLAAISHFHPESVLDAFSILDFVSDVDITQIIWGQIAATHGRRTHYSFNSPGLISAAANTSWKDKLLEQKRLGRAVAAQLGVPQSILVRPKLSFGIPSARWAGPGGVIEPILKVVAPEVDVELLRQFQGSDEKKAMIYWNWINYGLWKRLLINGESSQTLHTELDESIHSARG